MLVALVLLSAPIASDAPQKLIASALSDGVAYARLEELTDTIGPRLSGSPGAEAAVQWALRKLQQDGLDGAAGAREGAALGARRGERRDPRRGAGVVGHPSGAAPRCGNSAGGDVTAEVVEAGSLEAVARSGAWRAARSSSSTTP